MKKIFTFILLSTVFVINNTVAQNNSMKDPTEFMPPEIEMHFYLAQHTIKISSCKDKTIFFSSESSKQFLLVYSKTFDAWVIISNPSLKNETGYSMSVKDSVGKCDEVLVLFRKGKEIIPAIYSLIENDWIIPFPEQHKRLFGEDEVAEEEFQRLRPDLGKISIPIEKSQSEPQPPTPFIEEGPK